MARLVQEAGYRTDAFEARQLTEDFIRCASLVLTATRDHRRVVCEHLPSAVRRTFTLREFARLVASADLTTLPAGPTAVRLATAIPYALEQRGRYHVTAEDDGVVDPYGATESLYRRSFSTIESAVTGIAQALA
jgi:protein-tyrosine phosphatase